MANKTRTTDLCEINQISNQWFIFFNFKYFFVFSVILIFFLKKMVIFNNKKYEAFYLFI